MAGAEQEVETIDRALALGARADGGLRRADQHRARAELEPHLAVSSSAALGLVEDQLAIVAVARRHEPLATGEGEFRDSVHRLSFIALEWTGPHLSALSRIMRPLDGKARK
jgi:hypothetical protein